MVNNVNLYCLPILTMADVFFLTPPILAPRGPITEEVRRSSIAISLLISSLIKSSTTVLGHLIFICHFKKLAYIACVNTKVSTIILSLAD